MGWMGGRSHGVNAIIMAFARLGILCDHISLVGDEYLGDKIALKWHFATETQPTRAISTFNVQTGSNHSSDLILDLDTYALIQFSLFFLCAYIFFAALFLAVAIVVIVQTFFELGI